MKKIVLLIALLVSYQNAVTSMIPGNTCSAPIISATVQINCCPIHYELSGVDANGTIVFIHPYSQNSAVWVCFRNFFCAQGYRVLTLDLRGYGLSGSVPPFTIDQYTSDVDSLLSILGITQAFMVGYSMGGSVAMNYATQFPEKISKLVLLATSPKWLNDASWAFGMNSPETWIQAATLAKQTNSMLPFNELATVIGNDQCALLNPVSFFGASALIENALLPNDPQVQLDILLTGLYAYDGRATLHLIPNPTLIIFGCADLTAKPGAAIFMNSQIAGSIIVGFPGNSHIVQATAANAAEQLVLQFFQGTPIVSDISCAGAVNCGNCVA